MDNKLSVKDSSICYVSSFIFAQLVLVFYSIIGILICKFNNLDNETFQTFANGNWGYLISVILMNFTFLAVAFLVKRKKTDKLAHKVKTSKVLLYILLAVITYLVLYPVIVSFNSLLKIKSTNIELDTTGYIVSIFSRVLIPAICEEILFRGIIFKGIANSNKTLAIILTSIMFSVFHMSAEQMLYPLLMGLMLGVIMSHEDNIIYCIIVHVVNNALALSGVGYLFSHWTYYLIACLCFIAFVGVITYFILKHLDKSKLSKQEILSILIVLIIMIVFWVLVNIIG